MSIGACFYTPDAPKRIWVAGVICSVIPDLDVVGFEFGVPYGDFWGHRGFTHSLVFAAILATAALVLVYRHRQSSIGRFSVWLYFFLATASHGFLDAMTDGGLGVAFFAPFDNRRYFLPWRRVRVSPIGITRFFGARGLAVLKSELVWIWLPAALFAASVWMVRRYKWAPSSAQLPSE